MSYRVKLRPFLLTEGEFKGHLEYINFHVFLNGVEVGHWWELNQDQIPNSLGRSVGRPAAIECDLELRRGVTVDVPGECTEEQLRLLHTPRRGE
jgi:hypothetical protein